MSDDPVVADYLAGVPVADIARRHGVDQATVHRRRKAAGVAPRGHASRAAPEAVVEALPPAVLRRELTAGRTLAEIAAEHGVSHGSVRERAAALGLMAIDPPKVAQRLRRRYEMGATIADLAQIEGCSPRWMRTRLLAAGATLRPVGRRPTKRARD